MNAVYLDFIRLSDPNSMNYTLMNELGRYRLVEGATKYMKNWMGHRAQKVMGSNSMSVFCHCLMCSSTT